MSTTPSRRISTPVPVALLALLLVFAFGALAAVASAVASPPSSGTAPAAGPLLIAINAGGESFTDSRGIPWAADQVYSAGGWGYVGGQTFTTMQTIENTPDQALYRSERFNMEAYRFELPNGEYDLELHFAEIYAYTCPERRRFDVQVEGTTVLSGLDIFALVGAINPYVRYMTVSVLDGRLDVEFPPTFPPAKISGILVKAHAAGTATATNTATSTRTRTRTLTATPTGARPPGGYPTATPPAVFLVGVNAGGGDYRDSQNFLWQADQAYTPGSWGYIGGSAFTTSHDIAGAGDEPLYQTARLGAGEYRFDVANGSYKVELRFAEVYSQSCPTSRIFDVEIESGKVSAGLDLANDPGRYAALDLSFTRAVTDGQLNIVFSPTVGMALVSAIRVESTARGPAYTPTATATPIPPYDVRVNAGNGAYLDKQGFPWLADQAYTPGSWGYLSGAAYVSAVPIAGSEDDPLYQSERYWTGSGGYAFDVANGQYQVQLKFAEVFYNYAGARVFDVLLEGATALDNFDPLAAAGGARSAVDRTLLVSVSDGQLNVDFVGAKNAPKVNALRVSRVGAPTVTPTSTASETAVPPTATRTPTATATPTQAATATSTATATQTTSPLYAVRIDAGDGPYTDTEGNPWATDQAYAPGSWGYVGGQTYAVNHPIAYTPDPKLYQSERYNLSAYKFDVPDGKYTIWLKFAELYYNAAGKRVFDVYVNGTQVANRYDVFATAGAQYKATDFTVTLDVTGGHIGVDFVPIVGAAKINAIAVIQHPPPTPTATPTTTYETRVNAGGPAHTDQAGKLWLADQEFAAPDGWGYTGGSVFSSTAVISNTVDDALYQDERWNMESYRFTVANGTYQVELGFVELFYSEPGQRVFDVTIEGQKVLDNFDVFRAAGGKDIAVSMVFTTTVSDWRLNIDFANVVHAANVAVLRVTSVGPLAPTRTPTSTPSATGSSTATSTATPTITATATRTATATPTATFTNTATPTPTPTYDRAVNAGDGTYTGSDGTVWAVDQGFDGDYGHLGGLAWSTSHAIAGSEDDALYQSERYWSYGVEYRFAAPDGIYRVTLKFAENYYNFAGARAFDVYMEDALALDNFDIYAAAGGQYTAVDRVFTVLVSDGVLNIRFAPVKSAPKINAIRVTLQ